MRLDTGDKAKLRDLFSTQLRKCEQIPVAFSPAKHRTTQIDTENRELRGTSDAPQELASLRATHVLNTGGSKGAAASAGAPAQAKPARAKGMPAGRASAAAVSGAQELLEPPPRFCTLYQSEFGQRASGLALLTSSPGSLAAARLALEEGSGWAQLSKLEQTQVAREVSDGTGCAVAPVLAVCSHPAGAATRLS
jgi:hypothetical protein